MCVSRRARKLRKMCVSRRARKLRNMTLEEYDQVYRASINRFLWSYDLVI